jgi:transcriptional regulator with XRE-family HTH domain
METDPNRAVRAKIIGVLLKDARLAAGKTIHECAELLHCSDGSYAAFESGSKSLSLPQLELLAYLFKTPLDHFWSDRTQTAAAEQQPAADLPAESITSLRDRLIGAKLRAARKAVKIKIRDLAEELGLPPGRLSAYETGQRSIPLPQLEQLASRLGVSLEHFLERQGPVGEWDSEHRDFEQFRKLPPELREFVSQPLNESYLRLARQLALLSADKLRGIAESLLDITY